MPALLIIAGRSPAPPILSRTPDFVSDDGTLRLWTSAPAHLQETENEEVFLQVRAPSANHVITVARGRDTGLTVIRADDAGVPPIYHCRLRDGTCVVSTDLTWLVRVRTALLGEGPRLDAEAVALYLSYQYVPAPWTMWREIRQLQPGFRLELDTGGRLTEVSGPQLPPAGEPRPVAEVGAEALATLESTLRTHLAGARSVAALLSGGMDTSANVAVLAGRLGLRTTVYTASFAETEFDESHYAAIVARHFGLEHHNLTVHPDDGTVLPDIIKKFESPHGDRAIFAQHFLYADISPRHDVLVTGEGGDEIMGPPRSRDGGEDFADLPTDPTVLADYYLNRTCLAPEPLRKEFLTSLGVDPALPRSVLERLYRRHADRDPFERLQFGQWRTWMVHGVYAKDTQLARDTDMRLLLPFMNGNLMRAIARLPATAKQTGLADKTFMKAALSEELPPEILGKRKQKFWLPMARWFRGPWRNLLHDALLGRDGQVAGLVNPAVIRRLVEEHERGSDHNRLLWGLLFLELWLRGAR